MSWIARLLLGRPWPVERIRDLEVDLGARTVATLGGGEGRSAVLARLGPPDDYWASRRGALLYRRLGLALYVGAGARLRALVVYGPGVAAVSDVGFEPFGGRGVPAGLGGERAEQALVEELGPPHERESGDPSEGPSLAWTLADGRIMADLDAGGRLVEVAFEHA